MKKITSKTPITFRVNGTPGDPNSTVLHIDETGCLADERAAALVESRLGGTVTITDVDAKTAAKEAERVEKETLERKNVVPEETEAPKEVETPKGDEAPKDSGKEGAKTDTKENKQ